MLLGGKERDARLVRQADDRLFTVLGDKRGEVLGVALACSGSEARPRQKALECGAELRQRRNDLERSGHQQLSHRMRSLRAGNWARTSSIPRWRLCRCSAGYRT